MKIQLMDINEAEIDKEVLTGNPRRNLEENQVFNDEVVKWVKEYPDRLTGFAHAPP